MHEARESFHYHTIHDAHRAATKTVSLSEDSGSYRCYHEKGVVKDSFVSSRHIFSVCDDGCFAFVDVGGRRHIFFVCDDGQLKSFFNWNLDASKEVKLKIITAVLLASQTVALKDLYLAIEMARVVCLDGFGGGERDGGLVGIGVGFLEG
eukprot:scaffold1759_cov213-Skeletonema_marinoi.AAC.1